MKASGWRCPSCGRWIRDEPITRRCAACRAVVRLVWIVDTGLTSDEDRCLMGAARD